MLSDFSWDMTGYIPKHAVNPHGDGIIPYAAERIFQLEPEPPAVGNLNEYILSALQEKNLIYFSFFLQRIGGSIVTKHVVSQVAILIVWRSHLWQAISRAKRLIATFILLTISKVKASPHLPRV